MRLIFLSDFLNSSSDFSSSGMGEDEEGEGVLAEYVKGAPVWEHLVFFDLGDLSESLQKA